MKVAYLLGSVSRSAGGLFEICRRLSQSMIRHVDVSVLGLRDEFTDIDADAWLPVRPFVFSPIPPRSFGYASGYRDRLDRLRPDLVHVHTLWMYPTLSAYRWHQRSKRPFVFTANGMLDPWAVRNSGWKKRLVGSLWENAAHRDASFFHVNSEAEYQTVRAYGLKNPIAIIPNGIDVADLSLRYPAPWREDGGHKVLLYLGRLHPKKNLPALLDAWKRVQQSTAHAHEWVLVIAGWDQGNHEALLKRQARELGLEGSVHFAGPLFGAEKAGAYQHADAFVLPSLSEGLPMVVLEAWAYGKPVVMTPECNLPEGLAAGAALSTGNTAEALTGTLGVLFEMNDSERQSMGERGRALVAEKFLWPGIAEEMKRVCEWAVGGGDPPPSVRCD